jgi:hypothetical protein
MTDDPNNKYATKSDILALTKMIFELSLSIRAISLVAKSPDDEKFIQDTRNLVKKVTDDSHRALMELTKGAE